MSKNKNLIAVTMGDPSGISTEITIKAWIKKNANLKFFLIHDPVSVSYTHLTLPTNREV